LKPFLRRYLHGDDGADVAPVTVFETGENRWREFGSWPPKGELLRLYLQEDKGLAFTPPDAPSSVTKYISDPAKPVPYAPHVLTGR
jgi:predicted acyl esterase